MELPYSNSKAQRDLLVNERDEKLYQSFERMRDAIDSQIQDMDMSTVSEKVRRQQLEEIRYALQKQLQGHYNALESGLKDDMVSIGQSVLKESESFYTSLNMPIGMSITSFPVDIMESIVTGHVYQEQWYLSKALWGDYTEKIGQINEIIMQGVGMNLPTLEIAKQLEQYVDPSAMTPSKTIVTPCLKDPATGKLYSMDYVNRHPEKDWSGFKETKSRFRFGKVDYNAQRLARTLINHAYQQNVVHQAKANPFATGVRWDASGGERMCEICEERDGKIFPADDVPLDHPNGMCTFEVVTDLSMMEMSDVLADFVNGVPTDYDDRLYDWYNDRTEAPIQIPEKQQFSIDKFKEDAELYVAGGYNIDSVFDESELEYIQDHLEKYNGRMYRVEESVFTADKLDEDLLDIHSFSFSGSFRSFSRDFNVTRSMLNEMSDDYAYIEVPVIFEVLPGAYQFDMRDYTTAYDISDQKESLVGGTFKVVDEDYRKINGQSVRIITIKQISKNK